MAQNDAKSFCFQVLFSLYGDALAQLNRHREAEMWHKAALDAGPDHVPAHLSYGKWLSKNVSYARVLKRILKETNTDKRLFVVKPLFFFFFK